MENERDTTRGENEETRAQLRAAQLAAVGLEAQIAVLTLQLAHSQEDTERARRESGEFRARGQRVEEELAEVRGKYENLKRHWNKRKFGEDSEAQEGGENERRGSVGSENACSSPVEPACKASMNQPPGAICHKSEQERLWPQSPVVSGPSSNLPLSSNFADRDRSDDPRKRIKLDTSSPDLRVPMPVPTPAAPNPPPSNSNNNSNLPPSLSRPAPNFSTPDSRPHDSSSSSSSASKRLPLPTSTARHPPALPARPGSSSSSSSNGDPRRDQQQRNHSLSTYPSHREREHSNSNSNSNTGSGWKQPAGR
ncbi:hypothetical protein DFH09DRAFT_1284812 [Mycena vulgaris]|nr:hypothetical protein DFH09DRAFT_1284812 [Mycena vulgaris]